MSAFPRQTTPDPLFYRGLGYALVGAALFWIAFAVVVYALV